MKKKDKKIMKWTIVIGIILVLAGSYFLFFNKDKDISKDCYRFDYSKISGITCISYEGSIFGLLTENLNSSISPNQNCQQHEGGIYGLTMNSEGNFVNVHGEEVVFRYTC